MLSVPPAAAELTTGTTRFEVLDPVRDERWGAFVESTDAATLSHNPAWLALLSRTYAYPLSAWCLVDGSGRVRGGIPVAVVASRLTGRRLVSVPFSDSCSPLVAGGHATRRALEDALAHTQAAVGLPLRVHGELLPADGRTVVARFHHHMLELEPDAEAVIQRFRRRSSVVGAARQAARAGVRIERRTDDAALATFYRLHQLTRRRLGVPVQPRRFILGLGPLLQRGLGFVSLALAGDRAVGAGVFLRTGRTLLYKYGASDPAALRKRPNNLILLDVIRTACQEGFTRLDFGRADLGQQGLRAFKLAFGCEERVLEYHALGERGDTHPAESSLAGRLAPVLRHSPLALNRAVGELFYRHVG